MIQLQELADKLKEAPTMGSGPGAGRESAAACCANDLTSGSCLWPVRSRTLWSGTGRKAISALGL